MNNAVGPIFNESLIKNEICGSNEQCMRPTHKMPDAQTLAICAIQTLAVCAIQTFTK